MRTRLLEKFLRYAKINTQSAYDAEVFPSTSRQFDLARLLAEELKEIQLTDVFVDEHCYVTATIPANVPPNHPAYNKVPTIGLIAHLDTSPDVSGENVQPQVIENYQGGDIPLPGNSKIIIKFSEEPYLKKCLGHTLVTSDGTTLLGVDDKAGIAAIMEMAQRLLENTDILHGDIKLCFTPDEEVGQGVKFINLQKFDVQYAYTVDSGMLGELNKETFSANLAIVKVYGRDVHPGTAKNIMVNSLRAMADIINRLPKDMAPETTEGLEPYIHPHTLEGGVKKSILKLLFRDFKTDGLVQQKEIVETIIEEVKQLHPKVTIELEVIESYRNMRESLDQHPLVTECLLEAVKKADVTPEWKPIRGGTDGSGLTAMGIPTPNIFMGGQNYHSYREWMSLDVLEKTVETLLNLGPIWVHRSS